MKLSNKQVELLASKLFRELANGLQFSIFDLSKIADPVRKLLKETGDEEKARALMLELINKYKKDYNETKKTP